MDELREQSVCEIGSNAARREQPDEEPLLRLGPYLFNCARTDFELDQVHRLNFETFVREVAQYDDPGTGRLVDKFHHKNMYLIATNGNNLVGMIAAHDQPPFSIADRLADPGVLGLLGERPLEVRLLAIKPAYRRGPVFFGLIWTIHEHARRRRHTSLLISGLLERVPLYAKLGFRPLGPPVASGQAAFVPMALDLAFPPDSFRRILARSERRRNRGCPPGRGSVSLLPGPAQISRQLNDAWREAPVSHRGDEFIARFERVRDRLSNLVGGDSRVALFCGSGTLANDVIASTLASDRSAGRGLILVNGEFGARLARQAARFRLKFRVLRQFWGRPWDLAAVAAALANDRAVGWVWAVHLETSTGMLNDLDSLKGLVGRAGARLCVDAVSSLGAVPLDLRGVHLASSTGGKALGAFAGPSIVFANPEISTIPRSRVIPTYLDLRSAIATRGPRFTIPSPLLAVLDRSLDAYDAPGGAGRRYNHYENLGQLVRASLRALGIEPLVDEKSAAPVVTTFTPPGRSTDHFALFCRSLGYEVAYASGYLRRRGWAQIATMGDVEEDSLRRLFDGLARRFARHARLSPAHAPGPVLS